MLALFDEQFAVADFEALIEKTESDSESVLSSARRAVYNAYDRNQDNPKYVLDISDDIAKKIDNGEIQLVTYDGEVFAQLRDEKGRYGKRLPIKKDLEEEGVSAEQVQMALQMEAIKAQLKSIINSMKELEVYVKDVLQGQRNDRIGLYYSGMSLYLEASATRDEFLRKQLISQAIKSLNDANSQMIQDIRTSIEYLMTKKFRHSKNSKERMEKIDEHLAIIQQCCGVVFKSACLKAIIYSSSKELDAMLVSIEEYGRFVEKLIVPYVGELSELDSSVKLISKGSWGQMAETFIGCKNIREQISRRDTFLLSSGGIDNGN